MNKNNHRSFPGPAVKWPPAPWAGRSCGAQLCLRLIINRLFWPGALASSPPPLPPPGAAQAPLQYPPSLPPWDRHPEVRDTGPLLHEPGYAAWVTGEAGGEQLPARAAWNVHHERAKFSYKAKGRMALAAKLESLWASSGWMLADPPVNISSAWSGFRWWPAVFYPLASTAWALLGVVLQSSGGLLKFRAQLEQFSWSLA